MAGVKTPLESWLAGVRDYAVSIFCCGPNSIHGPQHWQQVESFGLKIAPLSGADLTVVRLFALLHDSCRRSDAADPDHGPRAAGMLERIVPSVFALDRERLDLLQHAIHDHTRGRTSLDPTIGTCWDADRLDIGRAGITPSPHYMSTAAGKEMAALGAPPLPTP
jgi:uncharacterized protein